MCGLLMKAKNTQPKIYGLNWIQFLFVIELGRSDKDINSNGVIQWQFEFMHLIHTQQ